MTDKNAGPENTYNTVYLEPRVAKLEVGMERLTDDVRNLAIVVREQGSQMEQEIQKLVIAVTQASGPRKTEWSTIISGVMLVLVIGSAAFWPMHQTLNDNKASIHTLQQKYENHSNLAIHPVGEAIINRIEGRLIINEEFSKRERELLKKNLKDDIDQLIKYYDQHTQNIHNKISDIEKRNLLDDERKKNELDKWRQKAMGLSDPAAD